MSAFQYKKILVVGATSGIGEDLANRIISDRPDSHVIAVGRRRANLDAFVEKHGKERASGEEFDITKLGEIEGFAKKITSDHPDLDCIILNSGIQRPLSFTDPSSIDLSTIELETTTNYTSYIYFLKYFLPHFQQKQEGKETAIVFVTSGLALAPISRCGNYCASKAALHHLILVLRKQMKSGPGNIKIIEILPPAVQTELHDSKHQPDIKDGHLMGMPLKDFTNAAWAGLERGDDNIPVGMTERSWKAFEETRLKIFEQMP